MFSLVSLLCCCLVPRQALWGAQLVHEGCSSLNYAGSLPRSIASISCCAQLLTRSYTLWSSRPGWCMKLAEVGTVTLLTSWDHGILHSCAAKMGWGLRWKGKGNASLRLSCCPPTMPMMRAGWGQGTDAVQCCADIQELEDLLKGRSVKTFTVSWYECRNMHGKMDYEAFAWCGCPICGWGGDSPRHLALTGRQWLLAGSFLSDHRSSPCLCFKPSSGAHLPLFGDIPREHPAT